MRFGTACSLLTAMMVMAATVQCVPASATELYAGMTTQGAGTKVSLSQKGGTSTLWKDTTGVAQTTCSGASMNGEITKAGGSSETVHIAYTSVEWIGCIHPMSVISNGELEIHHISGTTNGIATTKKTRIVFVSTLFGIKCTVNAGEGTAIGTVTGGEEAVLDLSGVITLENGCGDSTLTGALLWTSPKGLRVEPS